MFESYVDILADFVEKSLAKEMAAAWKYVSSILHDTPDAGQVAFLFGQEFHAFVLYSR